MKKKIFVGIGILVLLFILYNIIWYFESFKNYYNYRKEIPEVENSGKHIYVDEDKYQYSVKLPDYLCWNGNLAVSDENVDHALIIWLKAWGNQTEEGVILTSKSGQEQIELVNSKKAVDSRNQNVVDENISKINTLFEKANERWGLHIQ